jgi:hypothetical protein
MTGRKSAQRHMFGGINPEALLHVAYSVYVADQTELQGTRRHALASKAADEYQKYFDRQPTSLRDSEYCIAARAIVNSYVGAIWRHRRELDRALVHAKRRFTDKQKRAIGNRALLVLVRAAGQFLFRFGLFVAFGVAFAQVFAPFVPESFGAITGRAAPSVLSGIASYVIGQSVLTLWRQFSASYEAWRFNREVSSAWLAFMRERRTVYRQHLSDLCEVWKRYTGKTHRIISSMETVFADDEDIVAEFHREQEQAERSYVRVCRDAAIILLGKVTRRKAALAPLSGGQT